MATWSVIWYKDDGIDVCRQYDDHRDVWQIKGKTVPDTQHSGLLATDGVPPDVVWLVLPSWCVESREKLVMLFGLGAIKRDQVVILRRHHHHNTSLESRPILIVDVSEGHVKMAVESHGKMSKWVDVPDFTVDMMVMHAHQVLKEALSMAMCDVSLWFPGFGEPFKTTFQGPVVALLNKQQIAVVSHRCPVVSIWLAERLGMRPDDSVIVKLREA